MLLSRLMGGGSPVLDLIMLSSFGRGGPESESVVSHRLWRRLMSGVCRFVATLRGHVAAVYRVSWSSDSRMLVSASKDSTLKVSSSFIPSSPLLLLSTPTTMLTSFRQSFGI